VHEISRTLDVVARLANAAEFIEKAPEKYDTLVGGA
jgi:ABC-type multidrug transport system fused ATPase/permease subunit